MSLNVGNMFTVITVISWQGKNMLLKIVISNFPLVKKNDKICYTLEYQMPIQKMYLVTLSKFSQGTPYFTGNYTGL